MLEGNIGLTCKYNPLHRWPNPRTSHAYYTNGNKRKQPKLYLPPTCPLGIGLIQDTAKFMAIMITPMIQMAFP